MKDLLRYAIYSGSCVLVAAGCSSHSVLETAYFKNNRSPSSSNTVILNDRYLSQVQPVFSNRCVVCHTCVDAPCQLHLDTYDGARRGATFGDMGTLLGGKPTRDKDGSSVEEWRQKNFFSVIHEPAQGQAGSSEMLQNSLLYRFIELGYRNNQPGFDLHGLDEQRNSGRSCVKNAEGFSQFSRDYPAAGMPYGLPALDRKSFNILSSWISDGAPGPSQEAKAKLGESSHPEFLEEWEQFFNESVKSRLTARYIYEHSFMAEIHFDGTPEDEFYELVRSRTSFPEPVQEIVTERPYDSPGKGPFFYRFKKVTRTIVRKTHILWELSRKDLLHYKKLFLDPVWPAELAGGKLKDPGYQSRNPFEYFTQIPAAMRYRFMIENSRLLVNSMIRGPVCSGRVATYAIRDHFWVFFVDPSEDVTVKNPKIALYEWAPLGQRIGGSLVDSHSNYNEAMKKYKPNGFVPEDLWKGDGTNPNAILTVLRHGVSASVHHGPIGGFPGTIWVMNFSNLERIYYNLVVDFMPWGADLPKLGIWLNMSSHRAEGEERFISFLPPRVRASVREHWTSGLGAMLGAKAKKYSMGIRSVNSVDEASPVESMVDQFLAKYSEQTKRNPNPLAVYPKQEVTIPNRILSVQDFESALASLSSIQGQSFTPFLPNILFIRYENQAYTILTHRAYRFNSIPGAEGLAYDPAHDEMAAFKGIWGDRPELFIDLPSHKASAFIRDLEEVRNQGSWNAFKERYGIRRNDAAFWPMLDWFHEWDHSQSPMESGVFDVTNYDIPQN